MTKEELEKEAKEYLHENYCCKGSYCGFNAECKEGIRVRCSEFEILEKHIISFAEPREKQIQIDAEQIRALQKQNGELTDELKNLRESIKDYGAGCYENGLRNGKRKLEEQIEKMSEILLDLLWFEEHLDSYMYECNDAQKGELLKPFDNARLFLEKYKCKKCKGEGTIKVGYNGWTTNPCPACEGKGYILRR